MGQGMVVESLKISFIFFEQNLETRFPRDECFKGLAEIVCNYLE